MALARRRDHGASCQRNPLDAITRSSHTLTSNNKMSKNEAYRITPLGLIGADAAKRLLDYILKFQDPKSPLGVVVQYDELLGKNVLAFVEFKIDEP